MNNDERTKLDNQYDQVYDQLLRLCVDLGSDEDFFRENPDTDAQLTKRFENLLPSLKAKVRRQQSSDSLAKVMEIISAIRDGFSHDNMRAALEKLSATLSPKSPELAVSFRNLMERPDADMEGMMQDLIALQHLIAKMAEDGSSAS
jgi:DNA-binding transcriptional MerR regulator